MICAESSVAAGRLNIGMAMKHVALILVAAFAFSLAIHLSFGSSALAQATGPDKPLAGAVPGNTTDGASTDAELWRQIRQGAQGSVAGANKGGGLLIQSEGHYWQETRNGPVQTYSAWAILGVIMLLALFFAVRGRIRIDSGWSGRTIKRFSDIERAAHWLLASSFIVLALTGLNLLFGRSLLIPLIGKEAFAAIAETGKFIHNYVAFAFMVSLALVAVLWIVHNIPSRHDLAWLAHGGGLFGGSHPKAPKFNAGQKILFWIIILCGVSISLSGWALLNPYSTALFSDTFWIFNSLFGIDLPAELAPIQEQQYQSLWHVIMAVIMIMIVIAHIYIGTVGMEGAVSAMTSGDVDINWAREHHAIWVEEVEAGESGQAADGGKLQPAE